MIDYDCGGFIMKNYHSKETMHFKHITLKVKNIDRSLAFYHDILKLYILEKTDNTAILSANEVDPLIYLFADQNAQQNHTLGLYHYAILLSSRSQLAHVIKRLVDAKYPLTGASDHGVSEALYLDDPDGNGIELYADRDESVWPIKNDAIDMYTIAMDVQGVLSELPQTPYVEFDKKAVMGHLHFHVPDLALSRDFYCDALGFQPILSYGGSALFLSDNGYHHHLGTNIWNRNKTLRKDGDVGLIGYTLYVPAEKTKYITDKLKNLSIPFKEKDSHIEFVDPLDQKVVISSVL